MGDLYTNWNRIEKKKTDCKIFNNEMIGASTQLKHRKSGGHGQQKTRRNPGIF